MFRNENAGVTKLVKYWINFITPKYYWL